MYLNWLYPSANTANACVPSVRMGPPTYGNPAGAAKATDRKLPAISTVVGGNDDVGTAVAVVGVTVGI